MTQNNALTFTANPEAIKQPLTPTEKIQHLAVQCIYSIDSAIEIPEMIGFVDIDGPLFIEFIESTEQLSRREKIKQAMSLLKDVAALEATELET